MKPITSCKLGAKDCMVLQGTRANEICPECRMVPRGKSLETGNELTTPSHFVASPRAVVVPLRRKA